MDASPMISFGFGRFKVGETTEPLVLRARAMRAEADLRIADVEQQASAFRQ